MKMDRLIGIITILLRQDKVTAPELAERFEVSRRTINRDIEALCRAGIPLVTTQGCGGGISIAEGYKIDKTLFSEEELQEIFTGLKGMDSVSQAECLPRLMEKLSGKAGRIISDDAIVIDLASHYQGPLSQKIRDIKRAILDRRLITFQYYYEKGNCHRTIEPYRLLFKWSSWYVFGYCLSRDGFRLFKLNRLWGLDVQPDLFTPRSVPPEEFDLDRYYEKAAFHLKARFSKGAAYRLIEEYGIESFAMDPNGSLLFEWDFVSYQNMRQWVLSFGSQVEVLEPRSLRDDLCQQAANLLEIYKLS